MDCSSTIRDLVWKSMPMVDFRPGWNFPVQKRLINEDLPTHVSPMKITLKTLSGKRTLDW